MFPSDYPCFMFLCSAFPCLVLTVNVHVLCWRMMLSMCLWLFLSISSSRVVSRFYRVPRFCFTHLLYFSCYYSSRFACFLCVSDCVDSPALNVNRRRGVTSHRSLEQFRVCLSQQSHARLSGRKVASLDIALADGSEADDRRLELLCQASRARIPPPSAYRLAMATTAPDEQRKSELVRVIQHPSGQAQALAESRGTRSMQIAAQNLGKRQRAGVMAPAGHPGFDTRLGESTAPAGLTNNAVCKSAGHR